MKKFFDNFHIHVMEGAVMIYFLLCLCLNVYNIFALGVTCGIDSRLGIVFFTFVFLLTTCTSFFFLNFFCKESFKVESLRYLKAVYLFIVIVSILMTLMLDMPKSEILIKSLY